MTRRLWISLTLGVLAILGLAAVPAAAQTCDGPNCSLLATCTTGSNACEVGEQITFTLVCVVETPLEDCPFGDPRARCCEPSFEIPLQAWYNGEKKVNGVFRTDAVCVRLSNPLSYTFTEGDVGVYRRQACRDSSCTQCSQWLEIEVVE
jgi:hypothetical protein